MNTFRAIATIAAFSVASLAAATPATSKPKSPAPTTRAPKVEARAPKVAPKVETHTPKTPIVENHTPKTPITETHAPKAPSVETGVSGSGGNKAKSGHEPKASKASRKEATRTETPTADAPADIQPVDDNAVAAKINRNPEQLAKIKTLLPEGMTLEQASARFRNQGQFMAALNAAKNHPDVKFADLQKAMTVDGLSLGQAVKKLEATKPAAPTTTTPPGGSL